MTKYIVVYDKNDDDDAACRANEHFGHMLRCNRIIPRLEKIAVGIEANCCCRQ